MSQTIPTRRLSAILVADVSGYSRMMSADENGALASLKDHREKLFDPAVAAHNGRIVKLIGDGTLVEFASALDAVNCALAVQHSALQQEKLDNAITLRIGINLGDVIIDGDDIYGDGVNVATRLESLAEPGGICVSSIVNESVGNRVNFQFSDGGHVRLKNIDRPIHIWKWHPAGSSEPILAAVVPDRPSIAVLPFANMSGDPEQEYFSDGMTEDIITDLSKVAGLLVIARNSSFSFKGKNVDVRTIGRELGVRSVLEGSIRRAGDRVRITAQLIDTADGGHLWAERYDRDLTDVFALQDEVTLQIVNALKVRLSPAEKARVAEAGTDNVEAHDAFLKGREFILSATKNRTAYERAINFFNKAIELDPDYGAPYAGLAMACNIDFHNHITDNASKALDAAAEFCDEAVKRSPNDPFTLFVTAVVATFRGDFERAATAADEAIALSPNYAPAHMARGTADVYSGNPVSAIWQIEMAIRLDPVGNQQYFHFLGTAYLIAGKYEAAAAQFRERIRIAPGTDLSRALLASALGHLGQVDDAKHVWHELRSINPDYSIEKHVGRLPFRNKEDVDRIMEGLSKAGLS